MLASLLLACGGTSIGAGEAPANLAIAPTRGFSGEDVLVTITGTGFLAKATQPQGGGDPVLDTQQHAFLGATELKDVKWQDTTRLTATVPAGIAAGSYDLAVVNALGARGTAAAAYTVLDTPPFSATLTVDHPTVDVGQALTLTLKVTNGGTAPITGLSVGVPTATTTDAGSAGPPSAQPAVPASIGAGATLTFTWTYHPITAGHVAITVVITGTDSAGKPVTAALAAPASVEIQLQVPLTVTATPAGATTGFLCAANGGVAGACLTTYPSGTALVLTAPPAAGFTFTSWSGGTCTGSGACAFTMPATAVTVTANFTGNPQALTVTATPTAGTTGFRCAANGAAAGACAATYPTGTALVVTAPAAPGFGAASFSGPAGCSGSSCAFSMPASAVAVTATFTAQPQTLTVTANPANGTTGFRCAANGAAAGACAASYATGTALVITAPSAPGFGAATFSGGCTGATCAFTMPGNAVTVTASFTGNPQALTVTANPVNGTTGFLCAANGATAGACAATYPTGTALVITAPSAAGFGAATFSGGCAGATCAFTMPAAAVSVTATFVQLQETLTVTPPTGGVITCGGATCGGSFPFGTIVTLDATASNGFRFGAWTGDCASASGAICTLTMNANKTVSATFVQTAVVTLTVSAVTGSVSSTVPDGRLACGPGTCNATFDSGQSVTLAAAGGIPTWTGCTPSADASTCTLTAPADVTATFP